MVENENGSKAGRGWLIAIGLLLVVLIFIGARFDLGPLDLFYHFLMMISIILFGDA